MSSQSLKWQTKFCVVELRQYLICRSIVIVFQCFFGYSLHCLWMHDLKNQSEYFLWRNWCQCHFYHFLKALAKIVNTAIFGMPKRRIYRTLQSQCFGGFFKLQNPSRASCAGLDAQKFERWNLAVMPSMHPFYVLHPMHWQIVGMG